MPIFITDPTPPAPRPTKDVDIIVELVTRADYYHFADRLRERGFREDSEANILCRWRADGIIVDVMPTEPAILGFSNRWYTPAIAASQQYPLTDELHIRLVTPPFFLATKMEAFAGRGGGDFLSSNDIEDIVTLLDGRDTLIQEVIAAPATVRAYLVATFSRWMEDSNFLDALAGHLLPDAASQDRMPLLLQRIHAIVEQS